VQRFEELKEQLIAWGMNFGYTREQIIDMIPNLPLQDYALMAVEKFLHALPVTFIVLLFVLYMLLEYVFDSSVSFRVVPTNNSSCDSLEEESGSGSSLQKRIDVQIRKYIVIKVGVSILTGVLIGLTLALLHCRLAVM